MREFKDFDTMEKELKEKRGVISAFDFANEAVAIAIVAIDVATGTRNKELADAFAAMKLDEAVSKLFPEEPQDEKEDKAAEEPQEEKNTEKDAKFEDLKNLLFNHAADSRESFLGTDVENSRTAEMRRSAKHEALISLISNAGLGFEYCEWLRKKYE
uniref:Uncharacterized protein n=1 Tax=Myoviridae sp. ctiBE32 TaxID=2826685 RepID=A0A8S5N896_9CAUD|nr:MAG TPA: hypothetical protein [Myoviridae sp. ctiBE32]